jgi:hypothetical protein
MDICPENLRGDGIMSDDSSEFSGPARLRRILLEHLACPRVTVWPGADSLLVEDMLDCYHDAVAAGQAPGLAELLSSHPELAQELKAFFAAATASK